MRELLQDRALQAGDGDEAHDELDQAEGRAGVHELDRCLHRVGCGRALLWLGCLPGGRVGLVRHRRSFNALPPSMTDAATGHRLGPRPDCNGLEAPAHGAPGRTWSRGVLRPYSHTLPPVGPSWLAGDLPCMAITDPGHR